jgi:hypothetical protein
VLPKLSYELISLGMRYVFLLLLNVFLFRIVFLMYKNQRRYRNALHQLPDAGLVGEIVDLLSGVSHPLPKEGMMGSGRNCDVKLPGLKRREIEFVFRSGLGVKLIPIHSKHGGLLDGHPLRKQDAYALHGTILEIRGLRLRFRLFAGLDLPMREERASQDMNAVYTVQSDASYYSSFANDPESLPPTVPPQAELGMTWQYAPFPQQRVEDGGIHENAEPYTVQLSDAFEEEYQVQLLARRRRPRRERRRKNEK